MTKDAERCQQLKERLERQQPAQDAGAASAGMMAPPAPFPAQAAPALAASKQPAESHWDGDAGYRSSAPARDAHGAYDGGGANGGGGRPKAKGEDDWGTEVLGDDLLPM